MIKHRTHGNDDNVNLVLREGQFQKHISKDGDSFIEEINLTKLRLDSEGETAQYVRQFAENSDNVNGTK